MKIVYSILTICLSCSLGYGQNKKFQVNGAARGYLFANELDIEESLDSITPKSSNYGHTLIDLGFSIFPNENTEIISIFRIRNELGGFWGGGVSFNVRQLTLQGVAGNIVKYKLGDIDLKMTPYTMYNFREEGMVNEAEVFKVRRDIVHYDMFYGPENTWRMQGAQAQFGLNFSKGLQGIDFSGFITRQRPTDGITIPERLFGGGTMTWRQNDNLSFGLNSVNLFDLTNTINDSIRYTNSINTFTLNYLRPINDNFKLGLVAEMGNSNAQFINYVGVSAPSGLADWFYDGALQGKLKKQNISFQLGYKDVGADFFSPGAQTKRVNFNQFPSVYQQFTNAAIGRDVNLTDIINHNAGYTFQISETLMAYNAAYDNITPYGIATPNRRGAYINAERTDSVKVRRLFINAGQYTESRGTGTNNKRSFTSIAVGGDIHINDFFDWKKDLVVNFGLRQDMTNREGEEFEAVSLSSTMIDFGLKINLIDKLDLLLGSKFLRANGNEFMIERNAFNIVEDLRAIDIDFTEFTNAIGLRYRFSETNQLLINVQNHSITHGANLGVNYGIAQFNVLYTLTF